VLLVLGVVLALAVLAMAAQRTVHHLEEQRAEEQRLEEAVEAKQERIEDLRRRILRLREDPATLERLAREEVGLVRPGELVVVFPEPEPHREAATEGPVAEGES
jgi:cell division protein FtsB